MKKIMSLFIAYIIVFSTIFVVSLSVGAETLVESESNNDYSTADSLPLNSSVTGKMDSTSDKDVYKITVDSNGKLDVSFEHPYLDNNYSYWDVAIYKYSNGNYDELCNVRVSSNSGVNTVLPTIGVVKSESYYIKVSNSIYSETVGKNYTLSNKFTSTEYYEKELNNNFSTATLMGNNSSYGGCINSAMDADYFKVTTPSNGKLSLSFMHEYIDTTDTWSVSIYQYNGGDYQELYSSRVKGTDSEKISFPTIGAVKSKTYYIKISIGTFTGCMGKEYSIVNKFTTTEFYEKEPNNDYSTATLMENNSSYGGCINSAMDADYFKVTTPSNGKLSLSFMHEYIDTTDTWSISIYQYNDGEYKELYSGRVKGTDSEKISFPTISAVKSEIYYIKISIGTFTGCLGKEYEIVNEFVPDDSIKPTGAITSTNNISTSQTVTLKFSDNVGIAGYYWGTSSSYSNNSYVSTSSSSVTKTISTSGTYYLTVKDTSGNISTTYSITFYKTTLNSNGGSVSPTSILTKSGNTITLPTPTKSDSTFVGWGTSSSSTSGVKSITPTSNKTYYAIWKEIPKYIIGDVNGDGIVDAADAGLISRYDAGFITLTSEQLDAGDVNGDGVVDAGDAGIISRYDAGLISYFN